MEDELDDRILYQTYVSHMKIMSRIAWGLPLNISPLAYTSSIWRLYIYIIFGALVVLVFMYMQAVDEWSRNLLGRLYSISRAPKTKLDKLSLFNSGDLEKSSWELKIGPYAAYAIQGRRPKMEDRFVINDNINDSGVALFAVFDGHGGEFAANFAKETLVTNIVKRVAEIQDFVSGKCPVSNSKNEDDVKVVEDKPKTPTTLQERRKSFKKTSSTTDECSSKSVNKEITDLELLSMLDNVRPITREVRPNLTPTQSFKKKLPSSYIDKSTKSVNYGLLLTDEVLSADQSLIEKAKKSLDVAGTTALIAVLDTNKLIIANVGDSRGVMCDSRGNVIPLSFDHKPQQSREHKRIKDAGGFITFTGVWRVAGILATSRAMGDYPLKDKKWVIADPDILTFDLEDHKPMFIILASDGLWDTFSNEEAVSFIKERLHEPDYGAKSLTLQSYYRGSLDNITVIVISFKDRWFSARSSNG